MDVPSLAGKMIAVYNYRGDGETRVVTVVSVRDCFGKYLRPATLVRNINTARPKPKGRYLLYCYDHTREAYRSYYYEQCERIQIFGFFRKLWFTLTGRPATIT